MVKRKGPRVGCGGTGRIGRFCPSARSSKSMNSLDEPSRGSSSSCAQPSILPTTSSGRRRTRMRTSFKVMMSWETRVEHNNSSSMQQELQRTNGDRFLVRTTGRQSVKPCHQGIDASEWRDMHATLHEVANMHSERQRRGQRVTSLHKFATRKVRRASVLLGQTRTRASGAMKERNAGATSRSVGVTLRKLCESVRKGSRKNRSRRERKCHTLLLGRLTSPLQPREQCASTTILPTTSSGDRTLYLRSISILKTETNTDPGAIMVARMPCDSWYGLWRCTICHAKETLHRLSEDRDR